MKIYDTSISLLEVPGEISLNVSVAGCPLRCSGCHSPHLRNSKIPDTSFESFYDSIKHYQSYITCVNFLGGEWEPDIQIFINNLKHKYKISLYTGYSLSDISFLDHLDYIKTGPFIKELGGLNSTTTNQKMYKRYGDQLNDITYKFQNTI